MTDPTPPIVIFEGDDVVVYTTIAFARRSIEAEDVKDAVYQAFDSEGRALRLVAYGTIVSIEVPTGGDLIRRSSIVDCANT
jgi:hypothetical protein